MSTTKVQLGARVPASTRDRSVARARELGLSLNQYVEDALEAALGNGAAASPAVGAVPPARPATSPDTRAATTGGTPDDVEGSPPPPPAPPPSQPAVTPPARAVADDSSRPAPPPSRLPGLG